MKTMDGDFFQKMDHARMILHISGLLSDTEDAKVKKRLDKLAVKAGIAVDGKLLRVPAVSVDWKNK